METGTLILVASLGFFFIILPIIVIWSSYNSLVNGRNKVREGFSGISVQLKRRADLIPNLINAVKGYMTHERGLIEEVTKLRTQFMKAVEKNGDAGNVAERFSALEHALQRLLVVVENYPTLRASENFLQLQEALEETEDQIAASRRIYNANVTGFNNSVQMFPSNIVAGWFNFSTEVFFEIEDESDRQLPKVQF